MSDEQKFTHHVPEPCLEEVEVLHVDEHLIVVNKPSGLLSVPGRYVKDCVVHRLQFDHPDIRVVHRLDLDTSGIIAFANSQHATSDLNRQFRERTIGKEYEALVFGLLDEDAGDIDVPMRPDPENRPRQLVDFEAGKPSLTRFEVLERMENVTRVRLLPLTGRSHQLRIHMMHIGHPILGCDLYAHPEAFSAADRLCLHAKVLELDHPGTGERMKFIAPVNF
ncbi:MAG: RluA family pseudouridine synthase [Pseudomonadales bacterium]|jgi:tRNA pseudouridine32 synthase/23S rRNA pseudouridine746 synthase|nr:RluA family pseudouridine synthase [Pseudomonadales bacterium]